MKNYFSLSITFVLLAFVMFSACDKVEPPYKESETTESDTNVTRKFLLEEFTGHTCPNCPQGAKVAEQLKEVYGDRLIILSIHAADFAEPGLGEFAYDFRSPIGNDIFAFFQPTAFPSGMISRTGWSQAQNNAVIDKDAWGSRIESIKDTPPLATLEITNSYNTATRLLNADIELDALTDMNGTYKIAAYITEDSIVQAQLTENDPDYPDNIIHNYVHRHVLRGAMNGVWGDTLTTGATPKDSQFLKNYTLTLNNAWNENHCFVVAFVYDALTYEIVQVEEKKVK